MTTNEHDPQRAVGKTIAEVNIHGWRHEIVFTDDTKLQIEPGDLHWDEGELAGQDAPSVIFQERREAD